MPFFKLRWKGRPHSHAPRIHPDGSSSEESHVSEPAQALSHQAAKHALRRSFSSNLKKARRNESKAAASRVNKKGKEALTTTSSNAVANNYPGNGSKHNRDQKRPGRKKRRPQLWKAPSLEFAGVAISKEKRPTVWKRPSIDLRRHKSASSSRGQHGHSAVPSSAESSLLYPPGEAQRSWLASIVREGSGKSVTNATIRSNGVPAAVTADHVSFGSTSSAAKTTAGRQENGEDRTRPSHHPVEVSGGTEGSFNHLSANLVRRRLSLGGTTEPRALFQSPKRRRSLGTLSINRRRQMCVGSCADMSTIGEGSGSFADIATGMRSSSVYYQGPLSPRRGPAFHVVPGLGDIERKDSDESTAEKRKVKSVPADLTSISLVVAETVPKLNVKVKADSKHERAKSESGISAISGNVEKNEAVPSMLALAASLKASNAELSLPQEDIHRSAQKSRSEAARKTRRKVWTRAMEARNEREREQMLQRRAALLN